jgi:hypothetical protein
VEKEPCSHATHNIDKLTHLLLSKANCTYNCTNDNVKPTKKTECSAVTWSEILDDLKTWRSVEQSNKVQGKY